jgi:ParB/RepB/Spo0J family partition protein
MPESKRSSATTRSKPKPHEARRQGPASPEDPGRRIDLRSWRQARRKLSELKLPPGGPRREHGDLEELKSSIGRHGLLVPVLIEPDGTVRGGTRRLRALSELKGGQAEVECIILPPGTDPAVAQLVENVHRKDLTPLEEAKAYRALLEKTGWTQTRLASEMAKSQGHVSDRLALLRLPQQLQDYVREGRVSVRAALQASSEGRLREGPGKEPALPAADGPELAARSRRVAALIAAKQPVPARFSESSVKVPSRLVSPAIRARVFADRVEVTVIVPDSLHTDLRDAKMPRKRVIRVSSAIHKLTRRVDDALADALRQARRKVLILDGEIDE